MSRIVEIADKIAVVAVKFGVDEQISTDLGRAIVDLIMEYTGGGYLYVPRVDRDFRDACVIRRFNGDNHEEVCAHFKISRSTLYRIINR
jgi:Mor family transcriptional regulator